MPLVHRVPACHLPPCITGVTHRLLGMSPCSSGVGMWVSKDQGWGFMSTSTARVIFGQVLSMALVGLNCTEVTACG